MASTLSKYLGDAAIGAFGVISPVASKVAGSAIAERPMKPMKKRVSPVAPEKKTFYDEGKAAKSAVQENVSRKKNILKEMDE